MGNCYQDIYNEKYYKEYDVGIGKTSYEESQYTKGFLDMVAQNIVQTIHPKTVLDVGCAMGYLVSALRDRGVEAYGIDVSAYAVSRVREDIKPYCRVVSAVDQLPADLPQKYDLVTTIEVIEHLYEEDGNQFIKNICTYADAVLFSSTSDDIEEPTHFNVQQMEYWAKRFAKFEFYRQLEFNADYISAQAALFTNEKLAVPRLVENYERSLRILKKDAQKCLDLERQNTELLQKSTELQMENMSLAEENVQYKAQLEQLNKEVVQLEYQANSESGKYHAVTQSTFWRITKPFRAFSDGVKRLLKKGKLTRLFYKGLTSLKNRGVRTTFQAVKHKFAQRSNSKNYVKHNALTEQEKKLQRETVFPRDIKFSVLVPLYNTPEGFLKEMIQSVVDQTYQNWELCLADGSDGDHSYVGQIARQYANEDSRIKYEVLPENYGIAGNTNYCFDMATGDYIALFDHDDLLHPAALFECMKAVTEKNADFIYTDESSFEGSLSNLVTMHFKPDFSPDLLRSQNYICHLSVFSKELLNKVGRFSSEHDGSQDYDMVLRLTEQAKCIVHVPKILYYWRIHAGSVASDISVKPYCITSAKKAIADQLERLGLKGTVTDSSLVTTYRVNYEIEGNPLISILIPNMDHIADLNKCLTSIFAKSTYQNYEIIIIENNSRETRTFEYYKILERKDKVKVVTWDGEFNYSAINNFGFQEAKGDYILLLNNDVEVITPNWLEEMLMFAQRKDVGAVGAKLLYPDNTIQHAGVIVGIGSTAGHAHKGWTRESVGYMGRLTIAQDLTAVTAACVMVPRRVYEEINGLDETFVVALNDVDMCMRIRQKGYLVVFTPYAELYHYESKSRGYEDTPEKKERFAKEAAHFRDRWKKELLQGDPYYNPNLTLDREDFTLK